MKAKFLMLLVASGIGVASCSSSKQTTSGSDTTDTSVYGPGNRDTVKTRTGDTIRTDTTGRTGSGDTTTRPSP